MRIFWTMCRNTVLPTMRIPFLGKPDPEQAKKLLKEFILQYLIKCSYGVEGMSSAELCENLYEDMAGFSFLKKWIYRKGVEEVNINAYNDIEVITSGGRSMKIPGEISVPTACH